MSYNKVVTKYSNSFFGKPKKYLIIFDKIKRKYPKYNWEKYKKYNPKKCHTIPLY